MSTACRYCPHKTDEHTARGGCMHLHTTGAACGCTWTSGRSHGANPFTTKGK